MNPKPIVYALGKPAQRAVMSLARERDQLMQQANEVTEALRELARTYGAEFRGGRDTCRYDFAMEAESGQIVLHCLEPEDKDVDDRQVQSTQPPVEQPPTGDESR